MPYNSIDNFIQENNLIRAGDRLLLALSGGPDSVFLFHYLRQLHEAQVITLVVAHFNHEWRTESGHDAQFCADLAQQYDIPSYVATMSELTYSVKKTGSKEDYARRMRRKFFQEVAAQTTANSIVLAHHADDQAETFFIRLFRGSSIHGLSGMEPRQGMYVRPLLAIRKHEIIAYLEKYQYTYCDDSTNESAHYLRNRIRQNVLPTCREVDSRFDHQLERTMEMIQADVALLGQYIAKEYTRVIHVVDGTHILDIAQFFLLSSHLKRHIVMKWIINAQVVFTPTCKFIDEIIRYLDHGKGGSHMIGTTYRLYKRKQKAWIR